MIALALSAGLLNCKNSVEPSTYSGCDRQEIDGIVFEYCILNSEMEPVTQLKVGENFSIRFSVRNNTNRKLYFYPHFANDNENDFCRIFTANGQKVGKPYVFKAVNLVGIAGWPFAPNEEYVFRQLWTNSRDTSWTWKHGLYSGTGQVPLTSGEHTASFKESFEFAVPLSDEKIRIEDIAFKVNFNIN